MFAIGIAKQRRGWFFRVLRAIAEQKPILHRRSAWLTYVAAPVAASVLIAFVRVLE
jgi:hypothetical protein